MIQGLRCLPFTADLPIFDCTRCQNGDKKMSLKPQHPIERQMQACPFLPPIERDRIVLSRLLPSGLGFQPGLGEGKDYVPICPGALTGLPEVQEAVNLRPQWKQGTFLAYVGEGELSPALDAQAVLEGAIVSKQNHDMAERQRKAEEDARRG